MRKLLRLGTLMAVLVGAVTIGSGQLESQTVNLRYSSAGACHGTQCNTQTQICCLPDID